MQNLTPSTLMWCNDPESVDAINTAFTERGIRAQISLGSSSAFSALKKMKFDVLVLDLDEPGAWEVLEFQSGPTDRQPGMVIVVGRDPLVLAESRKLRVHFVLRKPFTSHLMSKTLGAAHHLMLKEKHIPFRKQVRIPVDGSFIKESVEYKLTDAAVLDISYSGLCLQATAHVPPQSTVVLDFRLPDSGQTMHVVGKVMWSDDRGKAGIQFESVPPKELARLRRWLDARCPWPSEPPIHTSAAVELAAH